MFSEIKNEFYIDSIGYLYDHELEKNFVFSGECHNFTEIAYLDRGIIEIVSGENVFILRAGDIIFHSPMVFHKLKNKSSCDAKLRNLSFVYGGSMPQDIYNGVYSLDEKERNEFNELFDLALDFVNLSNNKLGQEAGERLSAFILKLCRKDKTQNSLSVDSGALMFKKLVEKMTLSVYDNLSISELADEFNISVSYVKLLFKKYADLSPKNYFLHLKAGEAARLLRNGNFIGSVSDVMGFSSSNYFSAFFKKHFGVTPKEYRNAFCESRTE